MSLAQVYESYRLYLMKFVKHRFESSDPDDVIQSLFLNLIKQRVDFSRILNTKAYLTRAAFNEALVLKNRDTRHHRNLESDVNWQIFKSKKENTELPDMSKVPFRMRNKKGLRSFLND